MKFTSTQSSYLIVSATGALFVLILLIFLHNSADKKTTSELVDHTEQVISVSNSILLDLANHGSGLRGYLLTENELFLESCLNSNSDIKIHFNELNKLTNDKLQQQKRMGILDSLIRERIEISTKLINQVKQHQINVAGKISGVEQVKIIGDKIRALFAEINKREYELLKEEKSNIVSKDRTYNLLFILLSCLHLTYLKPMLPTLKKDFIKVFSQS